jgi:hypothetical protein
MRKKLRTSFAVISPLHGYRPYNIRPVAKRYKILQDVDFERLYKMWHGI